MAKLKLLTYLIASFAANTVFSAPDLEPNPDCATVELVEKAQWLIGNSVEKDDRVGRFYNEKVRIYYSDDGKVIVNVGGREVAKGKWFPNCEGQLQVVFSSGRNANKLMTVTPNTVDPVEDANKKYIATAMNFKMEGIKIYPGDFFGLGNGR